LENILAEDQSLIKKTPEIKAMIIWNGEPHSIPEGRREQQQRTGTAGPLNGFSGSGFKIWL
jgi:hypothetical protein